MMIGDLSLQQSSHSVWSRRTAKKKSLIIVLFDKEEGNKIQSAQKFLTEGKSISLAVKSNRCFLNFLKQKLYILLNRCSIAQLDYECKKQITCVKRTMFFLAQILLPFKSTISIKPFS